MTTSWHQPLTSFGQTTSIDLAKKQAYTTTSVAGYKRKPDQDYHTTEKSACGKPHTGQTLVSTRPQGRGITQNQLTASSIQTIALQNEFVTRHALQKTTQSSQNTARHPGSTPNPLLSLRHPAYKLPSKLVDNFESLGIHEIYPWQSSCLLKSGILHSLQNLVYTAPTGGGKSLVADVLMLKRVIDNPGKKAILVLPYVALVQEKLRWLRTVVENVKRDSEKIEQQVNTSKPTWYRSSYDTIRALGFYGGSTDNASWNDCDIAVCTIEKANSLINTAIEEARIDQLAVVVLDELHMLDDEHRGYIMELMATKLLALEQRVQLIGMSATLSNPQLIANWLKAKYYVSKFQPIPVHEYLVYDNSIYTLAKTEDLIPTASQLSGSMETESAELPKACRSISKSEHRDLTNPTTNAVVALAIETATEGYGALVFCGSRLGTEKMAVLIANAMPAHTRTDSSVERRKDTLASLQALPAGYESNFNKTLLLGVGFHHAGLTVEEREVIAQAYDTGIIKVLVATCSLAAGINLPARRVILNGTRMGRDMVGPAMLRQMRGRAGRRGRDQIGETYVCCHQQDLLDVTELVEAELPAVRSCLTPEKRGLTRALLEVICTRLATSRPTLEEYTRHSLLWHMADTDNVLNIAEMAIKELSDLGLIITDEYGSFEPTQLGRATVAAGLSPEDGRFVYTEMRRSLESFVMDGEMHVFYLFTPIQATSLGDISWVIFRTQLEKLDESGLRAMRLIGISPSTVNKLVVSGGTLKESTAEEIKVARIYRRAYSALQLRDVCNEIPIGEISLKYSVPRGHVQNLAQTCYSFGTGMIKFCNEMGWTMLAAVLDHTVDRLRAGARADLLEMAQVTYVKSRMARILWENGFRSVRALAEAEPKDIVPVMLQAHGRRLRLDEDATEKLRAKVAAKAEIIVNSANRLWERKQLVELDE